jgi:hypothetical protein
MKGKSPRAKKTEKELFREPSTKSLLKKLNSD